MKTKDQGGLTALHLATMFRSLEIIQLLLERASDISARCNSQSTVLHAAARQRSTELVKLLLKNGADPAVVDDAELTPYLWALYKHHESAAIIIRESMLEPIESTTDSSVTSRTLLQSISLEDSGLHTLCEVCSAISLDGIHELQECSAVGCYYKRPSTCRMSGLSIVKD